MNTVVRVFLSYDRTEKPVVEALRDRLMTLAGFSVAVDFATLKPGDRWRPSIHRWIDRCDVAVVVLSESALESNWVRYELSLLLGRQARSGGQAPILIPVLLNVSEDRVAEVFGPGQLDENQFLIPASDDEALEYVTDRLEEIRQHVRRCGEDTRSGVLRTILPEEIPLPMKVLEAVRNDEAWLERDEPSAVDKLAQYLMTRPTLTAVADVLRTTRIGRENFRLLDPVSAQSAFAVVAGSALVDEGTFSEVGNRSFGTESSDPIVVLAADDRVFRQCFRELHVHNYGWIRQADFHIRVVTSPQAPDHQVVDSLVVDITRKFLELDASARVTADDVEEAARRIRGYVHRDQIVAVVLASGLVERAHLEELERQFPRLTLVMVTGSHAQTFHRWYERIGDLADRLVCIGPIGPNQEEWAELLEAQRTVLKDIEEAQEDLKKMADA